MHRFYSVDLDSDVLDTRSWRWLKSRVESFLGIPESFLLAAIRKE